SRLAARLPDALIGLAPDPRCTFSLRFDDGPEPAGQALALSRVKEDRVEDGAEDVVLALVERPVADPHRPGAGIAGEIVSNGLRQVAPSVDPVHDLERAVLGGLDIGDELH